MLIKEQLFRSAGVTTSVKTSLNLDQSRTNIMNGVLLSPKGLLAGDKNGQNSVVSCTWRKLPFHYLMGLFLESPGNLTGPKSYFEIKVSRKVGSVLSSNEVHFVSLADTFTA